MKIHLIVAQRKESYPGEYAPEVLEAIDEYGNDANGEWVENKLKEYRDTLEFESVEEIIISVSEKAIMKRLRPSNVIKATIVNEEGQ